MPPKGRSEHQTSSLFPSSDDPGTSAQKDPSGVPIQWLIANVDGGARGNPGPAGYGVYLRDHNGKLVAELSEYLGHRTNNFAEYSALLAALEYALAHGYRALKVISDSELMVRQMTGKYRVNSPDLKPLYEKARALARQLDRFSIQHVLRAQNLQADKLANAAMDRGMQNRLR